MNRFRPFEEGPLFPDDAGDVVKGAEDYLAVDNEVVASDVAKQDISDMAESSFDAWVAAKLKEMGLSD